MKIDRLIGILSILLQQEKVTAPFLAEKFEVSRRTINRDIEDLCMAGIPLVTQQGRDGGISIMDGYRMDRTLLTSGEMKSILAGLRSLDSVSGTNRYQQLMEKLSAGSSDILANNDHILIDLSSQQKSSVAPKIGLIQDAIEQAQLLKFEYYSQKGGSQRQIEPYYLVFHWSSWYVWGYCLEKQGFRLFKLGRMMNLTKEETLFDPKPVQAPDLSSKTVFPSSFEAKILFEPAMKWRIIDEFGIDTIEEQPGGKLLVTYQAFDKYSLFSWILSFGNQAELAEPKNLRRELCELAAEISSKNKN